MSFSYTYLNYYELFSGDKTISTIGAALKGADSS